MNVPMDSQSATCGIFDVWCRFAGFEYLGYLLISVSLFGIWRLIYIHIARKSHRRIGDKRISVQDHGDQTPPDQKPEPDSPRRRPVYVDVDQLRRASPRAAQTPLVPQAVVQRATFAQQVALAPRKTENGRQDQGGSDEYMLRRGVPVAWIITLLPLGILTILGLTYGWWFPGLMESRGLTLTGQLLVGALFLCNLPAIISRATLIWMTDKSRAIKVAALNAVAVLIPATLFVVSIGMAFAPGSLFPAGGKPAESSPAEGDGLPGLVAATMGDSRTEEITRTPIIPTSVTYKGGSSGWFFGGAEAPKISGLAQPEEGSPYPFSTTSYETGSDWELVLEQTCVTTTSGSWLLKFPPREKTRCWTGETAIIGSSVFDE